jgi:hypothetical protein
MRFASSGAGRDFAAACARMTSRRSQAPGPQPASRSLTELAPEARRSVSFFSNTAQTQRSAYACIPSKANGCEGLHQHKRHNRHQPDCRYQQQSSVALLSTARTECPTLWETGKSDAHFRAGIELWSNMCGPPDMKWGLSDRWNGREYGGGYKHKPARAVPQNETQ